MITLPPNLCYTIALDQPGQDIHRRMARLLVTSLIHTRWHGRIVVFHNGSAPILPGGHPMVEELPINANPDKQWHLTMSWKYRVRDRLKLDGIGKVLFLDCDCIALRSINHLMLGAWDLYTAPEPGRLTEPPFNGYLTDSEMSLLSHRPGLSSGALGIRAGAFTGVMAEWERIDIGDPIRPSHCRDQHSWNRLILDTALRHRNFANSEIGYPFLHRAALLDYRGCALIHAASMSPEAKFSLLFGLWMEEFGRDHFDTVTAL